MDILEKLEIAIKKNQEIILNISLILLTDFLLNN